jgi:hypothetical protein
MNKLKVRYLTPKVANHLRQERRTKSLRDGLGDWEKASDQQLIYNMVGCKYLWDYI